jgi:hypothetical protein
MEKGDYPTACAKFTASLALVNRASTLLNLAQCEQHEGKLVAATKHWKEGIALLPAGDERVAVSKERAAALAPRLPHLTVKLSGPAPAGARVEVDGVNVPVAELGAGVPIDPGHHTVVLVVPGNPDHREAVDVVEGEAKSVTLSPSESTSGPGPGPGPTPEPAPSTGSGMRTGGVVLLGVGVAGGLVATITGGILVSKHSTITSQCPTMDHCSQSVVETIASTRPLNAANAAGWILGAVGVAGGVALVIVGGRGTATVAPTALPSGGGLSITGRF